jgi:hypothetical protein
MRLLNLFIASACILGGSVSTACAGGSIVEGKLAARKSCVFCHNIEENGPFKQNPPSFAAIAVYRSDNQIRNRIFYPDVHSGMRKQLGFVFSVDTVEDLVAYIRSLEIKITPRSSDK